MPILFIENPPFYGGHMIAWYQNATIINELPKYILLRPIRGGCPRYFIGRGEPVAVLMEFSETV